MESIIEEHGVEVENKEPLKDNEEEEKKLITEEDFATIVAESS